MGTSGPSHLGTGQGKDSQVVSSSLRELLCQLHKLVFSLLLTGPLAAFAIAPGLRSASSEYSSTTQFLMWNGEVWLIFLEILMMICSSGQFALLRVRSQLKTCNSSLAYQTYQSDRRLLDFAIGEGGTGFLSCNHDTGNCSK